MTNKYQEKFGYPAKRTRLKFSRLWDVEAIAENVARPPLGPKAPGI